MPTLNWIGKKAVENHHHKVPYHLLKDVPELSVGEPGTGNLLVEGDNLLALKALLPYYAGQVKCIYIDPPYNTGNEDWIYNDNVNSPEIKEWLGKAIGKEAEDLCRHDKWLCMMYPRLSLAKEFLAPDGILFVSIDDTELPFLRIILDELFPHCQAKNRLACFVWQTEGNFDNQAKVKICHEYVLAYCRNFENFPPPPIIDPTIPKNSKLYKSEIRNTIVKNGPKNPISPIVLKAGFTASFEKGIIKARNDKWPHYNEDLEVDDFKLINDIIASSGWSSKDICEQFIENKFTSVLDSKGQSTSFEISKTGAIECVKRRHENQSHVISVIKEFGSTQQASQILSEVNIKFDYPKPLSLIKYLISMVQNKSAIIMDFFAGSGTTGHAVMQLNKDDDGKRRFILVEMDPNICREATAERLKRVSQGYKKQDGTAVEGLNGGFRFATLGEPLFDKGGKIWNTVRFADLARHVYFTETGEPLPREKVTNSPLIGVCKDLAIYLLFNGIIGDESKNGGNVLTRAILAKLPPFKGPKIIYGAGCLIGTDRLRADQITFRQTPYEVRVS